MATQLEGESTSHQHYGVHWRYDNVSCSWKCHAWEWLEYTYRVNWLFGVSVMETSGFDSAKTAHGRQPDKNGEVVENRDQAAAKAHQKDDKRLRWGNIVVPEHAEKPEEGFLGSFWEIDVNDEVYCVVKYHLYIWMELFKKALELLSNMVFRTKLWNWK